MRNRLAVLAVAVTSFVVLAYTIPLALLVARRADDAAKVDAERQVQAVAAQLVEAVSVAQSGVLDDLRPLIAVPAGVVVADGVGQTIGDLSAVTPLASDAIALQEAVWGDDEQGSWALALPVVTLDGPLVVQSVVSQAERRTGVGEAWAFLAVLGLAVILAALVLADRLGRRLREPLEALAGAAERLGQGALDTRVGALDIEELDVVGDAFNRLAPQLENLLVEERESLADLSHRLRTPLAALRLQAEALRDQDESAATGALVDRMESSIDALIDDMRRGEPEGACDATDVVARRLDFWAVLAQEESRPFNRSIPSSPLVVGLSPGQLESLVDLLLGNVFDHTDAGTGFLVELVPGRRTVRLAVSDDGPGFPEGVPVLDRGASTAGSTGLGLDIARRLAEVAGGGLTIDNDSGAAVVVELPLFDAGDPRG